MGKKVYRHNFRFDERVQRSRQELYNLIEKELKDKLCVSEVARSAFILFETDKKCLKCFAKKLARILEKNT